MNSPVDTRFRVETPEGIELALSVAGLVPRGLAFLVDASIRSVIYSAAALGFFLWLGDAAVGPTLLVVFATEWFYPVAFEVLWGGRTPGKAGLGLRVVHLDGTPIRLPASLLRNLLIAADFLPVAYGFGIVSMLCDRNFRRLGDLAAGSLVVHTRHEGLPDRVHADAAPFPPPIALDAEEERAVIAFAERAPSLSAARADELAGLATPLGGTRMDLEGIAAHLLGREGSGR
ncbi:MAG: RDD family protein [bacterium]|nr:RDD family protein [bacterium]